MIAVDIRKVEVHPPGHAGGHAIQLRIAAARYLFDTAFRGRRARSTREQSPDVRSAETSNDQSAWACQWPRSFSLCSAMYHVSANNEINWPCSLSART